MQYNWAILGCGAIAEQLASTMQEQGREIYSAANRTYQKAVSFANRYGIKKVYENTEDIFTDRDVDIIYIATPHNTHIDGLRKALTAGKHVLCEKAITLNSEELEEAISLAEKNHVILAEAMTIYHMPIYDQLEKRIQAGEFGSLNLIQMNFGSYKEYDMDNRFFNPRLAGGAMLDIGVYALSFVRRFMSSNPTDVVSQVRLAPSGVDEQASILLKNKEGEMASVMLSLHSKQPKRGILSFDKAYIEMYEYPRGEEAVIMFTEDSRREVLRAGNSSQALWYEIIDMERAVAGQENKMRLSDTRDVMKLMTDIRREWGMAYPEEL